ncbi:MAG TPA: DNA-binding domain-containing protein [Polyangiaceae bacterium]|nr:DNA-binding domain-containing protein [Polyangiaceae bacterium]
MSGALGSLPVPLRDAQRLLFDAVTADDAPNPSESRLGELVAENGLPVQRRVAVYRDGYRARLVECLVDDYPAVQHWLGAEAFRTLCHGYIRDVPPGASLNFYGARFAEYCLGHAAYDRQFAFELAALEWALVRAVHGSDARRLAPEQLAELSLGDWEDTILVPSPTLTLLETAYPVNAYLQAFRDERVPEAPQPAPSWVVVCRDSVDVWRIDLPAPLGKLFASLVSGQPLAAALASVESPASGEVALGGATIQQAFSQWMSAGCFSGLARSAAPVCASQAGT